MSDPRLSIIDERLKDVDDIIAVSSGKGGVGKSLIASAIALTLAEKKYKVGLLDLDFTSPSTHVILNAGETHPTEWKGIIPPEIHSLKYMSIIYFSGNRALPLRGLEASNALTELLAITRWGQLDYLIVDMPPGIGDATLDIIKLIKRVRFLLVVTPSRLAFETVKKLIELLLELNVPVVGVIENMKMGESTFIRERIREIDLKYLGEIPFDHALEEAIGDPNRFSKTVFAERIREILEMNDYLKGS
ncbi:ATP-binding protein [Candidatus Bathyarchaeota archaeon]|nr:MAG: ATP-binding protein [Candidatus Bathyarchaeota archaeon]